MIVQAEAANRSTETDLASIYVRSRSGELVPLSNLVTTRDTAGARELGRFNKLRAITLSGGLAAGYSLGNALTFLEAEAAKSPEVTAVGYSGESKAFRETGGSIIVVFVLTILVVYLLLAAQFESFVHPVVIIATVPLAVAGGMVGLAAMGQSLNLYSQIGIVMLVGLAAKNGILIVEFANQLRDEGRDVGDRDPPGLGAAAAPDPDDLDRDRVGRGAADDRVRRGRRRAAGDRRGGGVGRVDLDARHPVPDPDPLFAARRLHRLARSCGA